jgi:hypothetical protein
MFLLNNLPVEIVRHALKNLTRKSLVNLWRTGDRLIQARMDLKQITQFIFNENFQVNED